MEEKQMAEGQAAAGHRADLNLVQMSWEGAGDSLRLHPTELGSCRGSIVTHSY